MFPDASDSIEMLAMKDATFNSGNSLVLADATTTESGLIEQLPFNSLLKYRADRLRIRCPCSQRGFAVAWT